MKTLKQSLSLLLALAMLIGMMPAGTISVSAEEPVSSNQSAETEPATEATQEPAASEVPEPAVETTEIPEATEEPTEIPTEEPTEIPTEEPLESLPEAAEQNNVPEAYAEAPTIGTCGESASWTFDPGTGLLTISGTGKMAPYHDPEAWPRDDYPDVPWIAYQQSIREVIVEEGITEITPSLFQGHSRLEKATLPDSLTAVGHYLFSDCPKLTSVRLPSGVTKIGSHAFLSCESLSRLELPEGLTEMGSSIFWNCTSLTEIRLPDGIKELPGCFMEGCVNLTKVTLPRSLTHIGGLAFSNCAKLKEIQLPRTIQKIGNQAFQDCINLETVTLMDTPVTFGNGAMITPEFTLNMYAFAGCVNLRSVELPDSIAVITRGVFDNCNSLTELILPENVQMILEEAFRDCSSLTEINIPASIQKIRNKAFICCSGLRSITIPKQKNNSPITIERDAFRNCTAMTRADLSNDVVMLGQGAFAGCSALTQVHLSRGMDTVAPDTFADCIALNEITIPDSVRNMNERAFSNCTGLKSIYFQGDAPVIHDTCFTGVAATASYPSGNGTWTPELQKPYGGNLTWKAYVPAAYSGLCGSNVRWKLDTNGVLTVYAESAVRAVFAQTESGVMDHYASASEAPWYAHRDEIEKIVISSSVKTVGNHAFEDCPVLQEVVVEAGVSHIGDKAFANNPNLKSVEFEGDAPTAGAAPFENTHARASFQVDNPTWTPEKQQQLGGNLSWEKRYLTWDTISVSTAGDISLNFYVKLSDQIRKDPNACVVFTFGDQVQKVMLRDTEVDAKGRNRLVCAMAARNMADDVTAQLCSGSKVLGEPLVTSIGEYCIRVMNHVESHPDSPYQKTVPLLKAMLNYGAYSQIQLNYNTNHLANEILGMGARAGYVDYEEYSPYAPQKSGTEAGLKIRSATLSLNSTTTIRVYLQLTGAQPIDAFQVLIDGNPAVIHQGSKGYYVELIGIAAKDLDVAHTFEVQGGQQLVYSGLSYVYQILDPHDKSEALTNVARALFVYNEAANTYFESK